MCCTNQRYIGDIYILHSCCATCFRVEGTSGSVIVHLNVFQESSVFYISGETRYRAALLINRLRGCSSHTAATCFSFTATSIHSLFFKMCQAWLQNSFNTGLRLFVYLCIFSRLVLVAPLYSEQ